MINHDDNKPDAVLVAQVLAGERTAFEPLVHRYYTSVVRLCVRLLGSSFVAQDIAQEAVLQAFFNLAQLHQPARFGAWLHAIAANGCRQALRRRRVASFEALGDRVTLLARWAALPTPEDVSAARETHDTVVAALAELSALNREVVIRFYLDGYSYAELADLLQVPVSTVKGRLFKARRQLRRALAPLARDALLPQHPVRKDIVVETPDVVAVQIDGVRRPTGDDSHVVVLREPTSGRVLPIYVGAFEANAIVVALERVELPRPMTHDLTMRLLATLHAQVQRVTVNRLHTSTFFADVELTQNGHTFTVDARPSDAFALAVRAGAPVFIARTVFDEASGEDTDAFWQRMAEHAQQFRAELLRRQTLEEH